MGEYIMQIMIYDEPNSRQWVHVDMFISHKVYTNLPW